MTSQRTTRRIVLLFGAGIDSQSSGALSSESSQLAMLLHGATEPVEVGVLSLGLSRSIPGTSEHIRLDGSRPSVTDKVLTFVGAVALKRRFATFPLGRLLNSLGPVDQGRVFSRTVRRHPAAVRLLQSADIAIAADVAATKLGWLAVHRGWVDEAYFDLRSASVGVTWQLPATGEPS